MVCNMAVYYLKAFSQAGCGSNLLKPPAVCTLGCQQSDHIVEEICLFATHPAPSVCPPPPQITYRPIKMHCRSMHSVMCDHIFSPLSVSCDFPGEHCSDDPSSQLLWLTSLFLALIYCRTGEMLSTSLRCLYPQNANVIHSVNNLL